jgi:DMSO/TMAO reductase YedYZ molybdopterin-dependent catalytic subunit
VKKIGKLVEMRTMNVWLGGLLGGISALVIVSLNYLFNQLFGLPRFAYYIFDWMARILPGGLITFTIDSIVKVIRAFNLGPTSVISKIAEQGIAILIFLLMGVVFGGILAWQGSKNKKRFLSVGLAGGGLIFLWVLVTFFTLISPPAGLILSILWSLIILPGWGYLLGLLMKKIKTPVKDGLPDPERRRFLRLVGIGSFTVIVTALGYDILRRKDTSPVTPTQPNDGIDQLGANITSGPGKSPPMDVLDARFELPAGVRSELTANENFYRIDINTIPPQINAQSWQLEITGLVDKPMTLNLDEIRSRESRSQAITLECISNPLGGDLISTSIWTGVPLKLLLDETGLKAGAQEITIESEDGFYESVPLPEALDERTLLVYEMNGEPLPQKHGYPLRIYIPNHFGMKQPKWIKKMEVIDHKGKGYWVDRGWSETAIPKTTSVIDVIAQDHPDSTDGKIPIAGIAYAGARGINKVEIRVDEGDWQAAELRTPPLSPLTWVQWRYLWTPITGTHIFDVRAYDGNGDLQETEMNQPHPDGATGIDSLSADIV